MCFVLLCWCCELFVTWCVVVAGGILCCDVIWFVLGCCACVVVLLCLHCIVLDCRRVYVVWFVCIAHSVVMFLFVLFGLCCVGGCDVFCFGCVGCIGLCWFVLRCLLYVVRLLL